MNDHVSMLQGLLADYPPHGFTAERAALNAAIAALSPPALDAPVVAPLGYITMADLRELQDYDGLATVVYRSPESIGDDPVAIYASPVAAQAVTWQPIETAPKDGVRLLLALSNGAVVIGRWTDEDAKQPCGPTDWQPLPAHPNAAPCDAQGANHAD